MKKLYSILILLILTRLSVGAQTKPVMTGLSKTQININSGANMIIIQGLSDGDNGIDQPISVEAISSDPSLLSVDSIGYNAGSSYAILKVTEQAKTGSVTLTIKATDADGTTSQDFTITIDQYLKHGVKWSVYDIVFWQQANPINEKSLYDSILTEVTMPTNDAIFDPLPLTVGPSAGYSKSTFITTMFKGYLVPPASGSYTFYLNSQDVSKLFLSPDDKFENAVEVMTTSSTHSFTQTLVKDKRYAMYATNYRVFSASMTLEWESTTSTPAVPRALIGGNNIFPSYDLIKPAQLRSQLLFRGIDMARFKWNKAKDNEALKGYNIYVNGIKTASTTDTSYFIKGLTANTPYSVFVTSYDANGNESFPINSISFTTYRSLDNGKPLAPTTVTATKISDMSADIVWSGAKDNETEVYAYNLYLDNVLYNTSGFLYEPMTVVKVLIPSTSHTIQIEAIDVAGNVSEKSQVYNFTTKKFDPLSKASEIKKARLNIFTNGIARNEGFGINGSYLSYTYYNGTERDLLNELKPGLQRWGALDANPLSFKDYSGQNSISYAKFMKQCNDMGSYAEITCGIRNGTDWVADKNTFLHFFEYLNGPASSTYGAIRASEGISEPLLKNSKGLVFEFGNEVWGESPWSSDYNVYGNWCRDVATLIKSSPYYDSTKVFFSYSGYVPGPNGSNTVIRGDTGKVDWISVSGYLDGNLAAPSNVEVGSIELDYYKDRLQAMVANINNVKLQLKAQYKFTQRYFPIYLYESNMSPANYNGRLGEAVIMTDYMLGVTKFGGALPTIFHLTSGQWGISSPSLNKKFPLFYTAKFVNHFTIGNMLKSEVQTLDSIPSTTFEAVGTYVFSEKGKYSILLLSRDFENDYQVQLNLPDNMTFSGAARKYVVTGVDFNTKEAIIDSSDVTLSDSMIVNLPKYSMVLYTFSGPDLNQKDLPLGYTRYLKIDNLTISPDAGTAITNPNQTLTFTAKLIPTSALYKKVKWSVTNSDKIPVNVSLLSNGKYSVQGSGTCAGNGKIMIKVMAADDTTIYDQKEITLSGQCVNGTTDALESSISLYPNPVKNTFNIESSIGTITAVRVCNLLGEKLQNIKAGNNTISVDLSNNPLGVYVIEVETEAGVVRKKILKQ